MDLTRFSRRSIFHLGAGAVTTIPGIAPNVLPAIAASSGVSEAAATSMMKLAAVNASGGLGKLILLSDFLKDEEGLVEELLAGRHPVLPLHMVTHGYGDKHKGAFNCLCILSEYFESLSGADLRPKDLRIDGTLIQKAHSIYRRRGDVSPNELRASSIEAIQRVPNLLEKLFGPDCSTKQIAPLVKGRKDRILVAAFEQLEGSEMPRDKFYRATLGDISEKLSWEHPRHEEIRHAWKDMIQKEREAEKEEEKARREEIQSSTVSCRIIEAAPMKRGKAYVLFADVGLLTLGDVNAGLRDWGADMFNRRPDAPLQGFAAGKYIALSQDGPHMVRVTTDRADLINYFDTCKDGLVAIPRRENRQPALQPSSPHP